MASDYLREETTNYIVIRVDNEPQGNRLPGNAVVEWMQYGGILRDVSVVSTPYCYIDRVDVRSNRFVVDRELTFEVHLVNRLPEQVEGEIVVSIPLLDFSCDEEIRIVLEPGYKNIEISHKVPQARCWSPETPYLYEVEAVFMETKGDFEIAKQVVSAFGR